MTPTSFFDYPRGEAEAHDEQPGFLAGCSEDDWELLPAHTETRRYLAGEAVIRPGEIDRSLYIVVEGTLETVIPRGRLGRGDRVATVEVGSVIGEVAFIDGGPRSALVRAMSDAQLLRLTFEAFEVLAAKDGGLARSVLLDLGRVLAYRLRRTQTVLVTGAT